MLRPLLTSIVLVLSLPAATRAEPVAWRGWDEGLAAASSAGKPVLVDVYTDWCGWCKRMDRDVYARTEIGSYLNQHFVMVRLNAESAEHVTYAGRTMGARALAGGFQVTGYPTTIFLRADGTHLVNVPGYLPAEKFMKLVRFIGDGHMDKGETWEEYSRSTMTPAK
jgi:thioredoxin-related protein